MSKKENAKLGRERIEKRYINAFAKFLQRIDEYEEWGTRMSDYRSGYRTAWEARGRAERIRRRAAKERL